MAGLSDKQRAFVAAYLGPSRLNATDAARRAGYSGSNGTLRVTGHDLITNPNVLAEIQAWRDQVRAGGIASLELRVQNLDGMLQDFYRIKQERADEWAGLAEELERCPDTQRAYDAQSGGIGTRVPAGAGTGWVIRQIKMVGSGPTARIIEEFGIDTSLVDRIVKVQEEAAKELGQRQDKVEVSGSLRREYVIVRGDEPDPIEGAG